MSKDKIRVRKQHSVSVPSADFSNALGLPAENLRRLMPSISVKGNKILHDVEFEKLSHQVAGHQFIKGKNTIGMLKCNDGTVLKPITKPEVGNREIEFYDHLQRAKEASLLELKDYCSNYYGTRTLDVDGKNIEFLILENLAEGISEPCIIDIKIGKQTWDPTASEEKIAREKEKYAQCKKDVSFCVPGFQVYKLSTGRVHKYNKEYGKKLNGQTVADALRIFLNGDSEGRVNRELLMQLLTLLWKIQKWARTQTAIHLYSTSLLIIYDCKILKKIIRQEASSRPYPIPRLRGQNLRKLSFNSPEGYAGEGTGCFSGQISPSGPILTPPPLVPRLHQDDHHSPKASDRALSWHSSFRKTHRSHSLHSNYNDFLSKIKEDYTSALEELNADDSKPDKPWFSVKIIDFAHAFFTEDQTPDTNYIEGIDSLVTIFEDFLHSLD